jgi:hypothetical protein
MVSEPRSGDKGIGGEGSGGEQEPDGLGDDDGVLLSVEELKDWSVWLPGVDYTRTIRQAKAGEAVVRRMLRRITRRGSRARTESFSTRGGEPVTRVDLHPEGWAELEALAELAADGERYRRLMEHDGLFLVESGRVVKRVRRFGNEFRSDLSSSSC